MLTSMYHTSSAPASLLFPQSSQSVCDMFTTDTILESDQCIWIVLCQRLSGWVHFPLPSPLSKQPATYVCTEDQIKSTQLSVSAIIGLWPRHSWRRKHGSQTMREAATSTAPVPTDRLEWVWFTSRVTSSSPVFDTPMLLMDLFTVLICSPRRAFLCVSVCVFSVCQIEFQHFSLSVRAHLKCFLAKQGSCYELGTVGENTEIQGTVDLPHKR